MGGLWEKYKELPKWAQIGIPIVLVGIVVVIWAPWKKSTTTTTSGLVMTGSSGISQSSGLSAGNASTMITSTNYITATNHVTKTSNVTKTSHMTKTSLISKILNITHTSNVTKTNYITKTSIASVPAVASKLTGGSGIQQSFGQQQLSNLSGVITPTASTGHAVARNTVIPSGVAYHMVNGKRVIIGTSGDPFSGYTSAQIQAKEHVSQAQANSRVALLQSIFPTQRG